MGSAGAHPSCLVAELVAEVGAVALVRNVHPLLVSASQMELQMDTGL